MRFQRLTRRCRDVDVSILYERFVRRPNECMFWPECACIVEYVHVWKRKVPDHVESSEQPLLNLRHGWSHWRGRCRLNAIHSIVYYVASVECGSCENRVDQNCKSLKWIRSKETFHGRLFRISPAQYAIVREYAPRVHHVRAGSCFTKSGSKRNRCSFQLRVSSSQRYETSPS